MYKKKELFYKKNVLQYLSIQRLFSFSAGGWCSALLCHSNWNKVNIFSGVHKQKNKVGN